MERYHHLEAAGFNLEQIELFHTGADGAASYLLDDSHAMVGVNDFIAYVETSIAADHEGTPTSAGKAEEQNTSILAQAGRKGNYNEGFRRLKEWLSRVSRTFMRSGVLRPKSALGFIIRSNMQEQIKKKLQDEMNLLEHELNHELPKELKKAVALGDLSENAEYHMAKQRQEFVKARLRQLGRRLADLSLINMNNIPKDKIGLGSTVRVYDNDKNEEVKFQLVTSEESDVAAGKISTTSPIGRALLNKKVGDTAVVITPNGKREMEVLSLTTIHDEVGTE